LGSKNKKPEKKSVYEVGGERMASKLAARAGFVLSAFPSRDRPDGDHPTGGYVLKCRTTLEFAASIKRDLDRK